MTIASVSPASVEPATKTAASHDDQVVVVVEKISATSDAGNSATPRKRLLWTALTLLAVALVAAILGVVVSPSIKLRGENCNDDKETDSKASSPVLQDPSPGADVSSTWPTIKPAWYGRVWNELVGQPASEAAAAIRNETNNGVEIVVVPPNTALTSDYNLGRVRIYVDDNQLVLKPPRAG